MKNVFALVVAIVFSAITFARSDTSGFQKYDATIPGSDVVFTMLPIPGGAFLMGSPPTDASASPDEQPQKKVQISAFWMGEREVSLAAFLVFFADESISRNSDADAITRPSVPYVDPLSLVSGQDRSYPAINIKKYAALMFCRWLYRKTGIFYRLPSEAEWEYAAKAGAATIYPFGNDEKNLGEYAWFRQNSNDSLRHGGLKKPNAWGLYDMLGNVQEWVLDQYQEDDYHTLSDDVADPVRVPQGRHPGVVRGGSYLHDAPELRPANRIASHPDWAKNDPQIPKSKWWYTNAPFVGFRIVRPLQQPSAQQAEEFFKIYLGK